MIERIDTVICGRRAGTIRTAPITVCKVGKSDKKHYPAAVYEPDGSLLAVSSIALCGQEWVPDAAPAGTEEKTELDAKIKRAELCARCDKVQRSPHELRAFASSHSDWVPVETSSKIVKPGLRR